jgi:hypothetical protein
VIEEISPNRPAIKAAHSPTSSVQLFALSPDKCGCLSSMRLLNQLNKYSNFIILNFYKLVNKMCVSILVISAILAVASAHRHARVYMSGKTGVSGTVDLMPMNGGTQIDGQLSGLTPGKHGFHVHEWGDIFSKGCDSVGGHFNPRKVYLFKNNFQISKFK